MDFDFIFPEIAAGYLSPDNIAFFYYTVAKGELEKESYIYEWNNEIDEYICRKGIEIEEKPNGSLPNSFVDGVVYFTIDKNVDNILESKSMAFIRHLRNAFAHYRICETNDFFLMKDYPNARQNDSELTMIGKIKQDDLKGLCQLLLNQGFRYNDNTIIINSDDL